MTPFIGVRISWLIVARKADLAREPSSAASRVSASSRRASCSERSRRAVRTNASSEQDAHADRELHRLGSPCRGRRRSARVPVAPPAAGSRCPACVRVVSDSCSSASGGRVERGCEGAVPSGAAPISQPTFSQRLVEVVDRGSIRKPEVGDQPEDDSDAEQGVDRVPGVTVGQRSGSRARAGSRPRSGRRDQTLLIMGVERRVSGDGVDRDVPEHQDADRDDREPVDHRVDVHASARLRTHETDPERRGQEDVGQEPSDVGRTRRR